MATKTNYRPSNKYTIIQFQDGLGKVWYKIRHLGWLWDSWYRIYYETEYGWTPYIPQFDSKEEAIEHLNLEKERYLVRLKRNRVTVTDLGGE
jgi:hypothetical protein